MLNSWTREEYLKLWPQAEIELRTFAWSLEPRAAITSKQLLMALELANKQFQREKSNEAS